MELVVSSINYSGGRERRHEQDVFIVVPNKTKLLTLMVPSLNKSPVAAPINSVNVQ